MSEQKEQLPEYLLLAARIGKLDSDNRALFLRKLFEWFKLYTGHDGDGVDFEDFTGAIALKRNVAWSDIVFALEEVTAYFYVHGNSAEGHTGNARANRWSKETSNEKLATFVVCTGMIGCAERACRHVDTGTHGLCLQILAMAIESNRLSGSDAAVVLRSLSEVSRSGLADWVGELGGSSGACES